MDYNKSRTPNAPVTKKGTTTAAGKRNGVQLLPFDERKQNYTGTTPKGVRRIPPFQPLAPAIKIEKKNTRSRRLEGEEEEECKVQRGWRKKKRGTRRSRALTKNKMCIVCDEKEHIEKCLPPLLLLPMGALAAYFPLSLHLDTICCTVWYV